MEFLWRAPDGATFPCEQWLPVGHARGVFLCIHGLGGAATDFDPFGESMARAGFATFGINLRGQGNDPVTHRRGAHLDLAHLEADLTAFAREILTRFPDRPVFWCGESMGAIILCHLLASPAFDLPVQGAIFSVPVMELSKPTPAIIRELVRFLAWTIPNFRLRPSWFVSGKAESLAVTRDEAHLEKLRNARHHIPAFSIGFLHALGQLMRGSHALAARVRVPSLVLAAGHDVFIRPEQTRAWYDCLAATDKELHVYDDAYHLLWNDWDRDLVLGDIQVWLDRQTGSLKTEPHCQSGFAGSQTREAKMQSPAKQG